MENEPQRNAKNIVILCNYNSIKNSETIISYFSDNSSPNEVELSIFNYRRIRIDGGKNYLFNSPGYPDFVSLKQVLSEKVDGVIVFVESSIGIFEADLEIIDLIAGENISHVLFANRDDFSEFEMDTHVEGVLIIPTIAREGIGIRDGLKMLLKLIDTYKKEIEELENYQTIETNNDLQADEDNVNCVNKIYENEAHKNNTTIEYDNPKPLETVFYKLRFFFHPIELDNVKNSMAKFGFSNLTTIDIKYHDNGDQKMETYRCSTYEMELPPKIEMIMIIKQDEIEYAIQALEVVKTDDVSEKLFITPVEDVIRIRTTERGENAVD